MLPDAERACDRARAARTSAEREAERATAAASEADAELVRLGARRRPGSPNARRPTPPGDSSWNGALPALEAEEAHLAQRERAMGEARPGWTNGPALPQPRVPRARGAGGRGWQERRRDADRPPSVGVPRLERNRAEAEAAAEGVASELDARAEATERLAVFVAKRLAVVEPTWSACARPAPTERAGPGG
ncbi:MAG: hypothetical protein IPF88_00005, partial [Candidatus Microthrix sp.]